MISNDQSPEKMILVCVATEGSEDPEILLDELAELVETAGGREVGRVIQNRENASPATYVGKGKIGEIRAYASAQDATGVVCDDELSPSQMRNLSEALEPLRVLDRTMVILDIFADRASSSEGKLEVELAQLRYRSARIRALAGSYDRQYGMGMRGPGEKKLETDRRLIRERIAALTSELKNVSRTREVTRTLRSKKSLPLVSIVGYTNAGKSTLLNKLTGSEVLEEDKLFATLDTTIRSFVSGSGQEILFSDTVGFIRKLPHHLVDAFKSTLDEARYADIILQVADASDPELRAKMKVVRATLEQLGISDKPVITVFNKCDKIHLADLRDPEADASFMISAKTGEGLDKLTDQVEKILAERRHCFNGIIPYTHGSLASDIRSRGQLLSEEYIPEGIRISAYVPGELAGRLKEFECGAGSPLL
ncbi:MAG: GTPase HflX [Lachnospiraceae bacterium]|nr:GTPase HflX [Lachnospiraceae bacterium]